MAEAIAIADHDHAVEFRAEIDVPLGESGRERVGDGTGNVGQIERVLLEQEPRPLGVRETGYVIQESRESERLGVHRLEVLRPGEDAILGSLKPGQEAVHRRPELVREVRNIRAAALLLVLERFSEAVQCAPHRAHLRVAAEFDARGNVTLFDPLSSQPDATQRPREGLREHEGDEQRGGDRGRPGRKVKSVERVLQMQLLRRQQLPVHRRDGDAADDRAANNDRGARTRPGRRRAEADDGAT